MSREFGASGGFDKDIRGEREGRDAMGSNFGAAQRGEGDEGGFGTGPPPSLADEDNNWRGNAMGPTSRDEGRGGYDRGGFDRGGGFDAGDPRGQDSASFGDPRGQRPGPYGGQQDDWRGGGPTSRDEGQGMRGGGGGFDRDGDWRGSAGPISREADPAGGFDRDQDWRGNAVGPISRGDAEPTRAGFDGNADWRSSAAPVTAEEAAAATETRPGMRSQVASDWRAESAPVRAEDAPQRGGAGGFDAADWRGGGGAGPTSRAEPDGDPRSGNVVAAPTNRTAGGDWVRGEVQARPDGPVRGAAGAGAGSGFSGGDPRGRAEPTRAPERGAPSSEPDWGRREPISRGGKTASRGEDSGNAGPAAGGRQRLQLKPRSQAATN